MPTRRKPARSRKGVDALPFIERLVGGRIRLGPLVEAIRQGEEMTQGEFAARLGVSKSHLCDIEKGRKVVSPERAARFAELLGYSSDQFVRLALQDAVDRAGLRYHVDVRAA
jgi:transcriptional regulator with XRE-family HTH domain